MPLPELPSKAELLRELERHEREVTDKLKLKGARRNAALDPHHAELPMLAEKLREASLQDEAKRADDLLRKVKRALVTGWSETRE
jgi:hypothetical protein